MELKNEGYLLAALKVKIKVAAEGEKKHHFSYMQRLLIGHFHFGGEQVAIVNLISEEMCVH